ncbi:MAG: phage major capsid protein [Spirochaetaceae bacterium]|nr:phage major capsid protein [Spirochaetaceae bacterium]
MTNAQKLALRLSEIRQKLNELSGKDELTDAEQSEMRTLTAEFPKVEERWRAATVAEVDDEAAALGDDPNDPGDGEAAELRRLRGTVRITDYLGPAAGGAGLSGAAAEFNAALDVPVVGPSGGVAIPWDALLAAEPVEQRDDPERRAFTTTAAYAGGVGQRPILQRLFGPDIMDALGVRVDAVPVGRAEWPLITGGVAPDQKPEGTAADTPVTAAFAAEVLKPKRLTGAYEYSHEAAAQVRDLEAALRRDLAAAVRAKMQELALLGDESTNAHEPDGFLTVLAAPTDPTSEADYSAYASAHAAAVDGIHASMETEVSSVIGVASYTHAAGVFQSGSGEAGSEALRRRSMSCRASVYVPGIGTDGTASNNPNGQTANVQNGNIFHAQGPNGGPMRGDSVAAVWPTLEVIRDIYTQSSVGVKLTWVALWDFQAAFRRAAYRRVAFKLA